MRFKSRPGSAVPRGLRKLSMAHNRNTCPIQNHNQHANQPGPEIVSRNANRNQNAIQHENRNQQMQIGKSERTLKPRSKIKSKSKMQTKHKLRIQMNYMFANTPASASVLKVNPVANLNGVCKSNHRAKSE